MFVDAVLETTIDYSGPAPGNAPESGHSVTFSDLGEGRHELLIEHRSGALYVDGFEIVSCGGGGPDVSAAGTRSVTTTSTGELLGLGSTVVTETVEVGADDEWLSVVVEGAAEPVTVRLLDPLGGLVAVGDQLLSGSGAVGLDIEPTLAGTYTVQNGHSGLTDDSRDLHRPNDLPRLGREEGRKDQVRSELGSCSPAGQRVVDGELVLVLTYGDYGLRQTLRIREDHLMAELAFATTRHRSGYFVRPSPFFSPPVGPPGILLSHKGDGVLGVVTAIG